MFCTDGPVYQPAGPMIEQHKGPNLGLPETVKLPPDLKVTYQSHPPSETATERKESHSANTRSQKSSKSSEAKSASNKKAKASSSGTSESQSAAVLHQPYKPAEVGSSRTVKIHQTTVVPTGNGAVATTTNSSSYSVFGGGGSGSVMGSPGSGSAISQQHTVASTNVSIHHPGLAVPSGGMFYPGYMGAPSQSPFAPNKYPMLTAEPFR